MANAMERSEMMTVHLHSFWSVSEATLSLLPFALAKNLGLSSSAKTSRLDDDTTPTTTATIVNTFLNSSISNNISTFHSSASSLSSTSNSNNNVAPRVSIGIETKKKKKKSQPQPPKPHISLLAGMTAGALEGAITYPTEFVKTQLQIKGNPYTGPFDCVRRTVGEKGIFGLYKGLSPLVIGNAAKAGVRFLSFDQLKELFINKIGMEKGVGLMVAGLGAGVIEGLLVVTPSETIKTKMIHDQNQANPRFRGLAHAIRTLVAEEGVKGIYRGVWAVCARQGANSAVRMSSYGLIRDWMAKGYGTPLRTSPSPSSAGVKSSSGPVVLPWYITFLAGALAGTITVYATMPLDVVKTRLQSLDGRGSILQNVGEVVRGKGGVRALWKGATPRLGRLIFSGGIVFTIYEKITSLFASIEE